MVYNLFITSVSCDSDDCDNDLLYKNAIFTEISIKSVNFISREQKEKGDFSRPNSMRVRVMLFERGNFF